MSFLSFTINNPTYVFYFYYIMTKMYHFAILASTIKSIEIHVLDSADLGGLLTREITSIILIVLMPVSLNYVDKIHVFFA
jgi:hypothetical protein